MDLANMGDTAGTTNFTIGVSGCTAPTVSAQPIKTVFLGNHVDVNGNLGNSEPQ
jgi:major type 1 subunit fimbrin (pilin)